MPCCGPSDSESGNHDFQRWVQIALFCAIVIALVKPLGGYMTRVFTASGPSCRRCWPGRERRSTAPRASSEPGAAWLTYAIAMLLFNAGRLRAALRRCSACRPSAVQSPRHARRRPDLAFNTAVSFVTNTNWQNYGGESTMSYLVQMARPDGAELRLGRDRHRPRRRADPRLRRAPRRRRSAISGSI